MVCGSKPVTALPYFPTPSNRTLLKTQILLSRHIYSSCMFVQLSKFNNCRIENFDRILRKAIIAWTLPLLPTLLDAAAGANASASVSVRLNNLSMSWRWYDVALYYTALHKEVVDFLADFLKNPLELCRCFVPI